MSGNDERQTLEEIMDVAQKEAFDSVFTPEYLGVMRQQLLRDHSRRSSLEFLWLGLTLVMSSFLTLIFIPSFDRFIVIIVGMLGGLLLGTSFSAYRDYRGTFQ